MKQRMNPALLLTASVTACLVLAACTAPTDPDANALTRASADRGPTGGPAFQTDSDQYTALIDEDGHPNVAVEIPMVFVNPTDETVYMIGCKRPSMPWLQRFEDFEWELAYSHVELMCLSPPFPIEPGEAFRDTLHIYASFPGQNVHPEFSTEVDGIYRLVRGIFSDPKGDHLLPKSLRTSNSFVLVAERK